jgi:hypothetical protein
VKYQRSIEPRLIEAYAIKSRDEDQKLHAIEKARRKAGSNKHVQKNGVIYKRDADNQIIARQIEENQSKVEVRNAAAVRLERKISASYKAWAKKIKKHRKEWKQRQSINESVYNLLLIELLSCQKRVE